MGINTKAKEKSNGSLGLRVREHLINLGLETATGPHKWGLAHDAMKKGVAGLLHELGQLPDPSRDDTPERVADMYVNDLLWGLDYTNFPKCTATPNGQGVSKTVSAADLERVSKEYTSPQAVHTLAHRFGVPAEFTYQPDDKTGSITFDWTAGRYDQMVRVAGIQTISLCEHHFQTIYGLTHVAYIPGEKVLGLSKFARITEFFARRPQIQERMTEQIYAALCFILETEDVAVIQDATHFCMRARGAMQPHADTRTDKMGGRFMSNPQLRAEFLNGIPGRG